MRSPRWAFCLGACPPPQRAAQNHRPLGSHAPCDVPPLSFDRTACYLTDMTRFLALVLALLVALTSQHMAVARGVTHDVAGAVVLCTGEGVRTVHVDQDGNPVEIVHICPDCALSLLAFIDVPHTTPKRVVHMQTLGQTPVSDQASGLIHIAPSARAPPVSV